MSSNESPAVLIVRTISCIAFHVYSRLSSQVLASRASYSRFPSSRMAFPYESSIIRSAPSVVVDWDFMYDGAPRRDRISRFLSFRGALSKRTNCLVSFPTSSNALDRSLSLNYTHPRILISLSRRCHSSSPTKRLLPNFMSVTIVLRNPDLTFLDQYRLLQPGQARSVSPRASPKAGMYRGNRQGVDGL